MRFRTRLPQILINSPLLSPSKQIKRRYIVLALSLCFIAIACNNTTELVPSPSSTQSPTATTALKIWWEKGFTLEEDEALKQVVSDWEKQSGQTIELTFYTTDELPTKTQRAMQAGNPPDIMMSHSAERVLNPRLAWEDKLADVSDVIEPIQSLYPESVLATVHFYNNVQKKRSYYGVPISQATIHIFYWRDLLTQVGRQDRDIPTDWQGFWAFWQQMQKALAKHNQKIYGLGFPVSVGASDTYFLFEQILEADNVQLLDAQGQLLIRDAKVRQGIIDSLTWYTQFYKQGYIPPEAVNWLNPDNNRQFLNRAVVMTPNATLSIPAAVQKNPDLYHHKLGI
ncbi:MAG: ABC transporter substrate-binding protein, partial [Microcystaceae cyanobacterium]